MQQSLKPIGLKKEDNYNLIEFTENTVILCSDYKLMDTLTKEIINTVNGKAEYNDYCCDDEDEGGKQNQIYVLVYSE